MSELQIAEFKVSLMRRLADVQEIAILKKIDRLIRSMSEEEKVVGYHPDGKPITLVELRKMVAQGEEEIDNGKGISLDDLEKMSEEWLK